MGTDQEQQKIPTFLRIFFAALLTLFGSYWLSQTVRDSWIVYPGAFAIIAVSYFLLYNNKMKAGNQIALILLLFVFVFGVIIFSGLGPG